jgi:hypothetical protein
VTKRVTYFEIDVPRCANTYGVSPCTASIPATGSTKCVNCFSSCQDPANFNLTTETVRFAQAASYLPRSIDALANIEEVEHTPAIIGLGDNLGERASLEVKFLDSPHSDAGPGYDPYLPDRSYNPWDQGTHWGKFRARYPFFQGADCRLIRGSPTQTLESMETRYFVAESMEGPDMDGMFSIIAKDPLKKLDGDRAQAPVATQGRLQALINNSVTSLTLIPAGIGDEEYPEAGWATIGGTEVVSFSRGGNDANTLILCHFDEADGTTTTDDESAFNRSVTASGNAHVETGRLEKFGSNGAAEFDGTGDFFNAPDDAAWAFPGDFTIDCWVLHDDAIGVQESYCSHGTNATNEWKFGRTAAGNLIFEVESSSVVLGSATSDATVPTDSAYHHVMVQRRGTNLYLAVDGVIEGPFDFTGVTIPNYTGTLRIGSCYQPLAFDGLIDEFRISSAARYSGRIFRPPAADYTDATDILSISRGLFGTTAVEHDADERVQVALNYEGVDVAVILADLLEGPSVGFDHSVIPLSDWQTETDAFLNAVYTAIITEPTSVNKLVSELIEQVGLIVWWSDDPAQINLQVLRSVASSADVIDENIILKDTLEYEDQPNKRASQVWTFFGQRDPTRPLDEESNYLSIVATDDSDTEAQGAEPAIKKIYSRWIPLGGQTAAEHLNEVLLSRYQIAPRRFTFKLLTGGSISAAPAIGYQIEAYPLQTPLGATETIPIQVTSVKSEADGETITAEEFQTDIPVGSTTDDVIILSTSDNNINLEDVHDQLYPVAESGDRVICYINSSVTIGSDTNSVPAFTVGSFATGVSVIIIVNGRIQGAGGNGGDGGDDEQNGQNGSDGGTAFYTRRTVSVAANEIFGGGGGGAGGGGGDSGGGGGGGGAGTTAGDRGLRGEEGVGGENGQNGESGTRDSGGDGGNGGQTGNNGGNGGSGGDPGQDGSDGGDGDGPSNGDGGNGGDSGNAVDGNSFVTYGTWDGSAFSAGGGSEDIRGPSIN